MKTTTTLLASALLLFSAIQTNAKDDLKKCWTKQVKPLQEQYLTFSYEEQLNELYHSPEPWQQMKYMGKGVVWYNADHYLKQDTISSGKRILYSKTQFSKNELLYIDYGRKELSEVNTSVLADQIFEIARYSPLPLLQYLSEQKTVPEKRSNKEFAIYKTTINKTVVTLYIDKVISLVKKVTTLSNDDLHGDVLTTISYDDYVIEGALIYPKKITIEKINGKLKDEITITKASLASTVPKLLDRPENYSIKQKPEEQPEEIKLEKYNDNIYFLDLVHAGAKTMIVVFSDFVLVAEAPLNNKNGELIISEAKKIAPGKPVRYFTFGHHHPHYLGGMRAFIHKGATILSAKSDEYYVRYLAQAPHTLQPDSLQYQPRALSMEEVKDSTTISDGTFEMKIYFVGKQSGHTEDYLVYYFPKERLLFEGDLVWVDKKGPPQKAGITQAGLYGFIKEHAIPVDNIKQSWGISFESVKTDIPFEEVEQSMQVK